MIQDNNKYYNSLKYYVDFLFKKAYRRVEYYGKEKIPQDGAIIYAPNHTNTLMDALAVLAIDQRAKVFVARADIFKKPLINKILTFLKMLPIHRQRDGVETLSKNEEVNNIVVNAMRAKVPFCILPEGTHRTMHSLLPLKKGIFRIAMQANDAFGNQMPVYFVPVGIVLGNFFRFRSTLLLQVGEPINVTEFVKARSHLDQPQQIHELRKELFERMKAEILYVRDDENYEGTWQLARLQNKNRKSLIDRYKTIKENIKNIENELKSNPQQTQKLLDKAKDFAQKRHALGIGMDSVLNKHLGISIFLKSILLLVTFPYFVFSAIVTSPVTALSAWLCKKFEDKAFHNTVRFLVAMVMLPLFLLIFSIIVFAVFSWKIGIIFMLLYIPSFFFLHEYLRLIRILISDIKLLLHKDIMIKV